MDIRKVKKLIEMLEASNLEEIEIQEGEESVRLVKRLSNTTTTSQLGEVRVEANSTTQENKEVIEEGNKITSPMVGTFYSAPSPGAKPFVTSGDKINEGDVVCIVEAMKMMNEIKSDYSGIISSVLVENSEPVEFGQTLFLIT